MSKIVATRQSTSGEIMEVKLDDGTVMSRDQAVVAAEQGQIENVITAYRDGTSYLRSVPDSDPSNNLSNLPSF